jgi:hypothetical protein
VPLIPLLSLAISAGSIALSVATFVITYRRKLSELVLDSVRVQPLERGVRVSVRVKNRKKTIPGPTVTNATGKISLAGGECVKYMLSKQKAWSIVGTASLVTSDTCRGEDCLNGKPLPWALWEGGRSVGTTEFKHFTTIVYTDSRDLLFSGYQHKK